MAARWHPHASEYSLSLNYERHTPVNLLPRSAFSRGLREKCILAAQGSPSKRVNLPMLIRSLTILSVTF